MRIWTTQRPFLEAAAFALLLTAPSALVMGSAAPARADTAAARAVIDETVADVLVILKAPGLDSPTRIAQIDAIARERFDFETMSRLVLRRSWKQFSEQEQDEFVEAFRNHLANSYGTRIDRYEQQDVKVTGAREEARGDVTVLTKIVGGSADDISMDYRVRNRNGRWRVIDVKIAGVSLVSNFRSQFKEVLSSGGPQEVLRRLKAKNEKRADAQMEPRGHRGPHHPARRVSTAFAMTSKIGSVRSQPMQASVMLWPRTTFPGS